MIHSFSKRVIGYRLGRKVFSLPDSVQGKDIVRHNIKELDNWPWVREGLDLSHSLRLNGTINF